MSNCSSVVAAATAPGHPAGLGLNYLGIALGCVGSICINFGNNLMAKGMNDPTADTSSSGNGKTANDGLWVIGTTIFVLASLIQFSAFAFAPASVIAPLESLQFVANLFFAKYALRGLRPLSPAASLTTSEHVSRANRYVNKKTITIRMLCGTGLIGLGVIMAVVFGPVDGTLLIPKETLLHFWDAPVRSQDLQPQP